MQCIGPIYTFIPYYVHVFQDYLSPAEKSSSCSKDHLSRLVLTTVQVLQASVIHIASSETLRPALLNAIHICCHFYSKHQNILTLPEPLTVPKVLHHIVAKLSDLQVQSLLHQLHTFRSLQSTKCVYSMVLKSMQHFPLKKSIP